MNCLSAELLTQLREQVVRQFVRVDVSHLQEQGPRNRHSFAVALANDYLLAVAPCTAGDGAFMVRRIAGGPRHALTFEHAIREGTAVTGSLTYKGVLDLLKRYAQATRMVSRQLPPPAGPSARPQIERGRPTSCHPTRTLKEECNGEPV